MATIRLDYAAVSRLGMLLDDCSWFTKEHSWLDKLDGLIKTLTGGFHDPYGCCISKCFRADIVRFIQISMKAAMVKRHIEVKNIPVKQNPLIRDAVTYDFVRRRAQ